MKTKALFVYAVLVVGVFLLQAFSVRLLVYLLPLYLLGIPVALRGRINFAFSARDLMVGLLASALILLPFRILFPAKALPALALNSYLFQLLAVSFHEEVFFRGFLQDVLGNRMKDVFVVSAMFAIIHLPRLIFFDDVYAPLTFFPSLVMGFLYMKTSNVLPSTVFHFLADMAFPGFVI
jgi:membrane protease YdiL (CAAX protease family)